MTAMGEIPTADTAIFQPTSPVPSWTVLATAGGLVLAQSADAYGVYNRSSFLGTWPLTDEGHRYAVQTYEAHRQSPAHGLAYTATGYQDPERLGLPTEPVMKSKTFASPMSYVGSTRRIVTWARKTAQRSPAFAVLAWTLGIVAILLMWVCILPFWYFVVFFLFGIFTLPYRLVRRSQRKDLYVQQTALATQQAMLNQMAIQQQQIQQQQEVPLVPPASQLVPPPLPPPLPPHSF